MNMYFLKSKLKTLPQFSELTEDELRNLLTITKMGFFKKNTTIFRQGEQLNKIFFILSGTIKIFHEGQNETELIVNFLNEGEMFPHFGFFKKRSYPANATIVKDAQLLYIDRQDLEALLLKENDLRIKFLTILGDKIVELQQRLAEIFFNKTTERTIPFLIRLCHFSEIHDGNYVKLKNIFTIKDIANMIGVPQETVRKTFQQLIVAEIIVIDKKGYYHIDKNRLKLLDNEITL